MNIVYLSRPQEIAVSVGKRGLSMIMGTSDNLVSESDMLTGPSNYSSWMYLVQSILEKEDLWDVVDPELEDGDTAPDQAQSRRRKTRSSNSRSLLK